mgnify:CR=1 FL=1
MKHQRLALIILSLALAGCASWGPRAEDEPRVPVYRHDQETPCDYEPLGRVVAHAVIQPGEREEWVRERALGRVGAEMGADAVILPGPEGGRERLPFGPGRKTRVFSEVQDYLFRSWMGRSSTPSMNWGDATGLSLPFS